MWKHFFSDGNIYRKYSVSHYFLQDILGVAEVACIDCSLFVILILCLFNFSLSISLKLPLYFIILKNGKLKSI